MSRNERIAVIISFELNTYLHKISDVRKTLHKGAFV